MKILIATLILLLFSNFSSANSEPSVESQQFCMDMGHYAEEIAVARDTTGIQHEEYVRMVVTSFRFGQLPEQLAAQLILLADEVFVKHPEVPHTDMYETIFADCLSFREKHGL